MKKKFYYFTISALLIFFAYFSYQILVDVGHLQIVFFDVGQGDSILVQKGTRQILIDGGPSGKTELAKLGKYLPYFDREIELVILTHPDKDHLAGLVEVARNYKIDKVLLTGAEKDTEVYKEWKDVLSYNKVETVEVWRGTEVKFEDVKMKVVHPQGKIDASVGDANNDSIVALLEYGDSSFLLTGDIESPAEREILESLPRRQAGSENIDVDVLKIAHHGSKYSSSEAFLDAASPEDAIISVSKNNSYGHPTDAVLEALRKRDVNIFRTDEMGDIIFECKAPAKGEARQGRQNEKCKITTQN